MSYLKFDKTVMINLEESLTREVLRTNRLGAYHSSTVVDCNTRKYHGLLVMPVPALDDDNHVLLSSLDETVIQHGAEFNLGLHKYGENNFSPKGHKYIREYTCDTVPRTVYRVGGVIFSKEKVFSMFENRIMIKYTLEDAHSATTLRFRPFLAFRSVKELTYANGNLNQNYTVVPNGIKMCLYPGYPELFMQFSKKVNFVFDPKWYYGATTRLKTLYDTEVAARTPRTSFYNCLKNSAQQFYFRPKKQDAYLLAGYPWFKVRARDLFLATPGCTLSIDDPVRFEKIMATALPALRAFMEDGAQDPVIQEIEQPDVILWAIWAIQQYAKVVGIDKARELYKEFIDEALEYIMSQKHPGLKVMDSGLLFADGGRDKAITWMNSVVNGRPVVPRSGYIVEFNAAWYNALCFSREMNGEATDKRIDKLISAINVSFPNTFVNGYNYLFDYVNGSFVDWSVRPNMIFAVALPYSPLTRMQMRSVLDIVTKELLTPKGIRSLSPKSEGYRPYCTGPQVERDLAYHQGTAWPWLLGAYLEAYLRVFGKSGAAFAGRMLISMEEEMTNHCIGTISEIYDGNPPFTGRGAISFAMNVAAILRIEEMLKKYNAE